MSLRIVLALLLLFSPLALAGKSKTVEVIIELDGPQLPKGQARAELIRILKTYLGKVRGKIKVQVAEGYWASQSFLVRLPESQIDKLRDIPEVRRVYPNRQVQGIRAVALFTPSDQPAQGNDWALARIGAPQAWAAGMRGQGVRIGHLDTGVDAAHPDLRGKVVAFAVIDENGKASVGDPYDSDLHGTYTAGLLVGNGVGIAPDARLVSALVLPRGSGTLAQVLGGLDWVLEQGVNIVSMSLGLEGTWTEFAPVIERMKQMGVLPIFAIGNSAGSTSSPGNMPDVLGVGASDAANQLASFSSRGEVRWGAPYNLVLNKPDLVAPGVNVFSTAPGGRYMAMSGTSVSTAMVAGSAALLMSNGQMGADQARKLLLDSAQALQAGSGRGLVRLDQAVAALKGKPEQVTQQPTPPAQPAQTQASASNTNGKSALLITEVGNEEPIEAAVKALGYAADQVKVKESGRPNADKLKQYQVVIWLLPANWDANWPEEHKKMLRAWVESGGRLLLISYQQGFKPISEASSYGKGKAAFVSGDLTAMPAQQQTKVIQGVIGQLVK